MLTSEGLLDHTTKAVRNFRWRFRMPYPFFKDLVEVVKSRKWFLTIQEDAARRRFIPVEIKKQKILVLLCTEQLVLCNRLEGLLISSAAALF